MPIPSDLATLFSLVPPAGLIGVLNSDDDDEDGDILFGVEGRSE